jgi:prepilin-type N-terminal cleavage/methylation domain-containing protein
MTPRGEAGFTLLETLVSLAVFGFLPDLPALIRFCVTFAHAPTVKWPDISVAPLLSRS